MQIKEIMTKAPTCCTPETTVDKIGRLMLEHDCGQIPVCDGTKLVGVITDRDIACRGLAKGKDPLRTTAREIMTRKLFTIKETDPLEDVVSLMEEHQVRRIPVVRDGKIVGIVALADLVPHLPAPRVTQLVRAISKPSRVVA
ncbi:MAG TPA: CBS domain-containing protein [Thermoanaerobaculia bacterium]|nr:CBS domain-containing protein [Thermoanaerobaculia bacterium]